MNFLKNLFVPNRIKEAKKKHKESAEKALKTISDSSSHAMNLFVEDLNRNHERMAK